MPLMCGQLVLGVPLRGLLTDPQLPMRTVLSSLPHSLLIVVVGVVGARRSSSTPKLAPPALWALGDRQN